MTWSIMLLVILLTCAIFTNIILRTLMWREKRLSSLTLQTELSSEKHKKRPPYKAFAGVASAVAFLALSSALPATRASHDLKRFAVDGIFCVVIPLAGVTRMGKFGKHIAKKIRPFLMLNSNKVGNL